MRVLIVNRDMTVGGGTTYILALARMLAREGDSASLLAAGGPRLPGMIDAFAAAGGQVCKKALLFPWDRAWFARFLRAHPADVVNVHNLRGMDLCVEPCLDAGVPFVATFHAPPRPKQVDLALENASLIVVMNETMRDCVTQAGAPQGRIFLSRLPVDLPALRAADRRAGAGNFVVTYCSRLSGLKGPLALGLMEAAGQLSRSMPDLTCVVIGGGPLRRRVAQKAQEINAHAGRAIVQVLGARLDAAQYLAGTSVAVGAGYVAVEALVGGAYVIGLGVRGCYGLVTEENFAEAVARNFGDHSPVYHASSPGILADAIQRAHTMWLERPECALRERAERVFSLEAVGPPLVRAYRALAAG